MPKELAQHFDTIWKDGFERKGTLRNHVQENYDYFWPARSDIIFKDEPGSKRHERVFVNVGEENVRIWANGLLNGIFPTTQVFHELIVKGVQKAALSDEEIKWLEDVARIQFFTFVNSNAHQSMFNGFVDEGVAGTSCVFIGESRNPDKLIHFQNFSIENFEIVEDAEGAVDSTVVCMDFTPYQMAQQFGIDALPASVKKAAQNKDTKQKHTVYFGVMPNPDFNPTDLTRTGVTSVLKRPFIGTYYMSDTELLGDAGFYEFPFVVTRVNKTYNERYGRSPASSCLHSIKMLTQQAEYDIIAVERASRPPYLVDSHSIMSPINPEAGTLTPFDSSRSNNPVLPWPNAERPDLGFAMEEKLRQDIEAIFMRDVFITLNAEDVARTNITATQLQIFKSERLSQLGPLLKVNEREKIRPIMNRIFGILYRNNMLPEPPESLQGREFEVSPTSPIYSAVAGASELEAMQRMQQYCFTMHEIYPQVWDNIDVDGGFKLVATTGGTASAFTRDKAEVDQIRRDRAEQQQMQAQLELQLAQQQMQQEQQGQQG